MVTTGTGHFNLTRWDNGQEVPLVGRQESSAIGRGNEPSRLELSCSGATIAASINGAVVASVPDTTYRVRSMKIGAGSFGRTGATEDRFDNLEVIER